ncbi:hypothetical protein [Actinomyces wuliandei]|uniref:hypothetical protein n=1 Tax=Actinomyces wuliandei TaxID=2057743 RepID=UPI0013E3F30C|nr:hypothetical protein [Actinomyces wuliandei]
MWYTLPKYGRRLRARTRSHVDSGSCWEKNRTSPVRRVVVSSTSQRRPRLQKWCAHL